MSESDRAAFAAYDVEFVVEISRCRAPLHRSTTQALRRAADVELYSSTALYVLYSSTALVYTLHPLHPPCGDYMIRPLQHSTYLVCVEKFTFPYSTYSTYAAYKFSYQKDVHRQDRPAPWVA